MSGELYRQQTGQRHSELWVDGSFWERTDVVSKNVSIGLASYEHEVDLHASGFSPVPKLVPSVVFWFGTPIPGEDPIRVVLFRGGPHRASHQLGEC